MKIFKNLLLTFTAIFVTGLTMAQNSPGIEMADGMRASGKIYVVVAVLTIIFLGIALYLFLLDRKINKLERELEKSK